MTKVIDLSKLYDPAKNKRQYEAHESPERYILYGGAYGGGKTAWLINEGIRLSIKFPGNRGYLCCKFLTDFRDNALKQLEKFLPSELISSHHKTERYFRLINGSLIMYGGLGNDVEAVKTISNMPELGWFGVDQAEQITERQFLLLDGRLRLAIPGIIYKALLTANPEPGWLRDRFIENPREDHKFIPALPTDNPFLPKDYAQRLKQQYPEALARRLLEGDWDVDLKGNYLIPYSDIRDAVNRNLLPEGDVVIGADVAWRGVDESVVVVRQGKKVIRIEAWAGKDTQTSSGLLAQLIREYKPKTTYMEAVGIGAGIFDTLKNAEFQVEAVWGSAPAKNDKIFSNKRAEYYSNLANRFREGEVDIPDNGKLQAQLASITYAYDDKTRLKVESKDIIRKELGGSPDYADALMLAFIDAKKSPLKPIETLTFSRSYR